MIFSGARRFGGRLAAARLHRGLLLAGPVSEALPVGSALADTTIGQIGAPAAGFPIAGGFEIVQTAVAMPAAGTITSFSAQSGDCSSVPGEAKPVGPYDFQVLRPLGSNEYEVVGPTGQHTDPCDGDVHSYAVRIPVRAGDVLGVGERVTSTGQSRGVVDEPANLVTVPTTKAQCKNGGWQNFGSMFKKQGDCVSFVATGGNGSVG